MNELPCYDQYKLSTPPYLEPEDEDEREPGWDESDYLADAAERELDAR